MEKGGNPFGGDVDALLLIVSGVTKLFTLRHKDTKGLMFLFVPCVWCLVSGTKTQRHEINFV